MHKFEIRNAKHETIPKLELPNVQNSFGHLNFGYLDLFRIGPKRTLRPILEFQISLGGNL
jgi:hypothetical protein